MKTIRIDGVIGWDVLASEISEQIKDQDSIELVVNSGGGSILEGFSIYNLLKSFSGYITAKVDFAASMASVIVMAADKIVMKDNSSIMMIHRPWTGVSGNSEDLRRSADTLDKLEEKLTNIYMTRATVTREDLSKMLDDETYLDAKEAKDIGLIDEIESGKVDFESIALVAMQSHEKVDFSTSKFLNMVNRLKSDKPTVKTMFDGCHSLADIETTMRNSLKLSRSEALAITAAVKKIVLGDQEQTEILNTLKNLSFGDHQK